MDTSDWLQGMVHEGNRMDSSSPSDEMITCSRPLVERRVRPQHDQTVKCPRCDSTYTKFCYYNNYSLSQPRYFCKACRRYWTKGGSLRNIPVGGGCRKNKRVSVKKSTHPSLINQNLNSSSSSTSSHDATDLHLTFPQLQFSHLNYNLLGNSADHQTNPNLLDNTREVDFMESKFDFLLGNPRSYDFMGNSTDLGLVSGVGDVGNGFTPSNFHSFCSPFNMSLNGHNENLMETSQNLMLPFEGSEDANAIEMKPNKQVLSLGWHDQGCYDVGRESFEYMNGLGSWGGAMNGYGSSAANPSLV